MKKLFRSLFILSLSVVGLSGCSLEELFGGGKVADHIDVRDYSTEVYQNEKYTFDGKVYAVYEDNTEADVTKKSTISTIDTSSLGAKELTVRYEDSKYIHKKVITIDVIESKELQSISLPENIRCGISKTKTITPTFYPVDAANKEVTYSVANTSVATISNKGVLTPIAIGTTTLTVKSVANPTISATANLVIDNSNYDDWTILVYMCGANLESDSQQGGAATEDLQEIASVSGQPSDVNVVVQAGGARSWKSTYSSVISKDTRNRIHLNNKSYVRDDSNTQAKENMGAEATLKSFVEWGLETYPADKIGLIFWNHGGAMSGCCGDEQFSNDYLMNDEVVRAIRAAKSESGYSDKFEFIGYDCCLMQIQDIVGTNSEFAKYMVASEASEWGYGWSYETWIDDVYQGKSTEQILSAIVDGFAATTDEAYDYWNEDNDQTLSYVNLSYWAEYQTAWDNMITSIGINSKSKWNTFTSVVSNSFTFENGDYDNYDVGSFISKMKSSSYKDDSTIMNRVNTLSTVYKKLVGKSWHGNVYTDAQVSGLCLFCPLNQSISKTDYNTTATPFGAYRTACINYGWSSY